VATQTIKALPDAFDRQSDQKGRAAISAGMRITGDGCGVHPALPRERAFLMDSPRLVSRRADQAAWIGDPWWRVVLTLARSLAQDGHCHHC
jgi:hypothetical protein